MELRIATPKDIAVIQQLRIKMLMKLPEICRGTCPKPFLNI